jgi:hypothetical protein
MIELFKNRKAELHTIAENFYQRLITKQGNQRKALLEYLNEEIKNNDGNTKQFFIDYKDNLKEIILAKPHELYTWAKSIENSSIDIAPIKEFFIGKKKGGYYSMYDRWGAYELAKKLKVDVCPYCNRNYTFTLGNDKNGKKGTRPDFDHFFDKATYPYLALSFYNLVPSCNICNSDFKGSKKFNLDNNIHPYFEGFEDKAKFTSKPKTYEALLGLDETNLEIKIEVQNYDTEIQKKIAGNINAFKINDLYAQHTSVVSELYMKKQISNDQYIKVLQETFKNFNLSKEEIYRLAFGNFLDEKDFHLRPLSKLTHDIAQELGLLP